VEKTGHIPEHRIKTTLPTETSVDGMMFFQDLAKPPASQSDIRVISDD